MKVMKIQCYDTVIDQRTSDLHIFPHSLSTKCDNIFQNKIVSATYLDIANDSDLYQNAFDKNINIVNTQDHQ